MKRLVRFLASKPLAAYLIVVYATFLVLLFVWGARIPPEVVANIAGLAPFWMLYSLGALHLFACLAVFIPSLLHRVSIELPAEGPERFDRVVDPSELPRLARRHGYRWRWLEPDRLGVGSRFRWSPAGTLLFHGAILLVPAAILLSRATRFEGEAWIVEGHPFEGTRSEYTKVIPADSFERRAPHCSFDVEEIGATFWGDRLFFTDLRALLAIREEGRIRNAEIRLPQPTRIDGARVSIRGFNYTPSFTIEAPDGTTVATADLNLRLFPPGVADSFEIEELPYQFHVRLYPDSGGPASRPRNRGFGLERPLFHVAVTSGKRIVSHGWIRPGERWEFDGFRLIFTSVLRGGDLLIHKDLGYPVLWAALLLALAGVAARIVFPSSCVWVRVGEGAIETVVREDPFSPRRAAEFLKDLIGGDRHAD